MRRPDPHTISYEYFQELSELTSVDTKAIQVEDPDGQLFPRVLLSWKARRLGSTTPGNERVTHGVLIVRPEYLKTVVHQTLAASDLAELLA